MAIPEAYWVLNDKVNLPKSHIGSLDEVLVPGGERWAGIGIENGNLAFSNARELLKPQEFGEEFQSIGESPKLQISAGPKMNKVWEHTIDLSINDMPLLVSRKDKIKELNIWAPGTMFSNFEARKYHYYHPLVLETKNGSQCQGRSWFLVGYNKDHGTSDINKDWTSLPTINYLPEDADLNDRRIIAGSAGLLVIDGGHQGTTQTLRLWGRPQIPNEMFWKHPEVYKGPQSMVFITNPLTREYILLPPIPGRLMNKKSGRFIWRNKERTSYMLVLVGWDAEIDRSSQINGMLDATKNKKGCTERIGLFVYCSASRCYVYYDELEGRPLPFRQNGGSCIGIINYGIFVGAMKVNRKTKPKEDKHPCVFHFNISNLSSIKKTMIPFVVKGISNSMDMQAPKVVQAGPSRIFAITRESSRAITFYVVEIVLDDCMQEFQSFKLITSMPRPYFRKLFCKTPCNDPYEITSCNGVISFMKSGTKENLVILYNVNKAEWYKTNFPRQVTEKVPCYHLADATHEPNFLARP